MKLATANEWVGLTWSVQRTGYCEAWLRKLGDEGRLPMRRKANGWREYFRPAVEELAAARRAQLHDRAAAIDEVAE